MLNENKQFFFKFGHFIKLNATNKQGKLSFYCQQIHNKFKTQTCKKHNFIEAPIEKSHNK